MEATQFRRLALISQARRLLPNAYSLADLQYCRHPATCGIVQRPDARRFRHPVPMTSMLLPARSAESIGEAGMADADLTPLTTTPTLSSL